MSGGRNGKPFFHLVDLIGIGTLTAWGAFTFVILVLVWVHGSVTLVEPNKIILGAEIILALFLTILGLNLCWRLSQNARR